MRWWIIPLIMLTIVLTGCECDYILYYPVDPATISITGFSDCQLVGGPNATEDIPPPVASRFYPNRIVLSDPGAAFTYRYECAEGSFSLVFFNYSGRMNVPHSAFFGGCSNPDVQRMEEYRDGNHATQVLTNYLWESGEYCSITLSRFENSEVSPENRQNTTRDLDRCLEETITAENALEWVERCDAPVYADTRCSWYTQRALMYANEHE